MISYDLIDKNKIITIVNEKRNKAFAFKIYKENSRFKFECIFDKSNVFCRRYGNAEKRAIFEINDIQSLSENSEVYYLDYLQEDTK